MTEEMLMAEVKAGNLQQATPLFDAYNKRLYNFFVKITFDKDLGHDLTQNTFLRMIKYRQSYKKGMKFQSWIFQIARNVYADHYKKGQLHNDRYVDVASLSQDLAIGEEDRQQIEKEQLLYASMSKLNREDRELLVMSRFMKMKYEEIAMTTDYSVSNVKVKVHRAIRKLRGYYFEFEKA